jgi:ribonuclease P protein component
MPYAYRKSERIRKNTEFVTTMKGKRLSLDGLSLFYTRNETGNFRVGISVSKKLANAVKRNRLRRQIRVCVMRALKDHALGIDLVFVARQQLTTADFGKILKTVETLLSKTALRAPHPEGTISCT